MYAGFLTFKLNMTSALLVDRANAIYRSRWDLDVRALRVLRLIASCPGVAPKVIAQRAFIEKTLLSKILGLLESRRLITRRTNTGDRRSVALEATPDGCNIAETSEKIGVALETELMTALTETQRNTLDNILAVLTDSLLDETPANVE
ncbi:MAG: MarR family transcriptional regulator [Paraburkholderia sp.]|uniref:MarR family winged helix-turn-helix transcriptional regulator n=1 Tax=Paraburkholderia sp. TaxID=1926495 RepID=UPI001204012B|nr:MarR family winged helix-turn-helix transcriptional regulator [Paraburkholderia sp.]TAM02259.1 MAG: MarR family transcriptional regulator [Paraburkholderia sp.]